MRANKRGVIVKIAKSAWIRRTAFTLALILAFELGLPSVSWALTSGPGQPEYSSFEPASTTDMVNHYDGSFTYNIPLINLPGPNGGYPINLSYHGNPGMEEEASWVGLGWALNVGAINRQLQGLPDDFNGDLITYEHRMKENWGFELGTRFNGSVHREIAGFPVPPVSSTGFAFNTQLFFNNYRGFGYRVSSNLIQPSVISKTSVLGNYLALNLSFDSQNGIGIAPQISTNSALGVGLGATYNNRSGLNAVSFTTSFNLTKFANKTGVKMNRAKQDKYIKSEHATAHKFIKLFDRGLKLKYFQGPTASASLSYSFGGQAPNVGMEMNNTQWAFDVKILGDAPLVPPFSFEAHPIHTPPANYTGTGIPAIPSLFEASFYHSNVTNNVDNELSQGYLYHNNSSNMIKDYTKKQVEFNKKLPNLGSSKQTYDMFTFTGQGTGGFFRAYGNNIDLLSEKTKTTTTVSNHATVELGVPHAVTVPPGGPVAHIGLGYFRSEGTNTTGDWINDDIDLNNSIASPDQKVFRLHGENSPVLLNDEQLGAWHEDEAMKNVVESNGNYFGREYKATSRFTEWDGSAEVDIASTNLDLKRNVKDKRNTSVKYYTTEQASQYGFSKNYQYYDASGTLVTKSFPAPKNHHISEIVVTQTDGARYVYGMPVYNNTQVEISQSCGTGVTFDPNNPYSTVPNGTNYNSGIHQYNMQMLNKTTKPGYAYSWLLTGVVGADYIDDDGIEGISDGDKGYWVKFTYKKCQTNYPWRVPYTGSNIIEGRHGVEQDNIATFSHGEKEIYYLYSIESPTHIAIFETGDRGDGIGSDGEYASAMNTTGVAVQKYLKSIKLYAKPEYLASPLTAIPLNKVNLKYDYHLCRNIPNYSASIASAMDPNNFLDTPSSSLDLGGKLSLREVSFEYENSTKAKLSPYKFYYDPVNDLASGYYNPDYNLMNLDRWGNYKNNSITTSGYNSLYNFGRFPYTEQKINSSGDLNDPSLRVAKWTLHRIKLPTGGEIKVDFEPHDYASEEDQNPMQMFDIVGVGNKVDATSNAILNEPETLLPLKAWYEGSSGYPIGYTATSGVPDRFNSAYSTPILARLEQDNSNHDAFKIFFKLDKPYSGSLLPTDANQIIREKYTKGLNKIWFKNKTLISKDHLNACMDKYEYVDGYANIDKTNLANANYFGMCRDLGSTTGPLTVGFISLKMVKLKENGAGIVKCNDMTKLALQKMRLDRDDVSSCGLVGPSSGTGTVGAVLGFLASTIGILTTDLPDMLLSYNLNRYNAGNCKFIELNGNSKIKLHVDGKKFGGGYRVKQIKLTDNWKNDPLTSVSNIEKSEYGQKFVYTMTGNVGDLSSGVCYEPANGNEESALRKSADYVESIPLGYHSLLYVEKPILDFYYPGASIGYRKVTTYSISRDIATQQIAATGAVGYVNTNGSVPATVMEFYTPKEFPIKVDETNIQIEAPFTIPISVPGIYNYLESKRAASQGYSITLNDMAGKLKRTASHRVEPNGHLGALISSTEYIYKTKGTYNENSANELDNTVQLAINDHQFSTGYMGVYYDMFIEKAESRLEDDGFGVQANLEVFSAIPFIIPTVFPSGSETQLSNKSIVTHKIVYRSGIIDKTITKADQSVVTSQNLLFDSETGSPVLIKSDNIFEDPIYAFTHPAHWYYENTGPMYKNDYWFLSSGTISGTGWVGGFVSTAPDSYLNINNIAIGDKIFVRGLNKVGYVAAKTANSINLIGSDGNTLFGSYTGLEMIQSGRKNLLSTEVGGLVAMEFNPSLPLTGTYGSPVAFAFAKIINASAIELSDHWQIDCCSAGGINLESGVIYNPFVKGGRNIWRPKASYGFATNRVYNNNSRTDGYFDTFAQFNWVNPTASDNRWIKAATTTKYSPYGFEAESVDALGNYSAARYGYNNRLAIAVASNSSYNEMDFEGFETDYVPGVCSTSPLTRLMEYNYTSSLSTLESHTGKRSIEILPGSTAFVYVIPVLSAKQCSDYIYNDATSPIPLGTGTVLFNIIKECTCFGSSYLIAGTSGKKYILSAWAKQTNNATKPVSYTYPAIKIEMFNSLGGLVSTTTNSLNTQNKIVEGWQRFFVEFTVPATGVTQVKVTPLHTGTIANKVFFDDFRIHPNDANMVSYVYDKSNFKLRAELDANNFATFYNYDEEGNLINNKKETLRGIKTITEGRKELQK